MTCVSCLGGHGCGWCRYNTARKRFLAGVESERQAEAQFFEAQAAARKEAQRLKKEREEQR